ncbi:MAG: hypothetical protein WBG70_25105 [Spirulinaceae cyanobacterium]
MKPVKEIDIFAQERPLPSPAQRRLLYQQQLEQEKRRGYAKLTELCRLGENDAARHLARRNPQWGYQVVEGQVY